MSDNSEQTQETKEDQEVDVDDEQEEQLEEIEEEVEEEIDEEEEQLEELEEMDQDEVEEHLENIHTEDGEEGSPEPEIESANEDEMDTETSDIATQHVGIDIGTENLVTAMQEKNGNVKIGSQRNAFIEVPGDDFTLKMINERGLSHAERDGNLYVLGDAAFDLARILNKDPQRPMDRGVLSPEETDAIPIITMFLEELVGHAASDEAKAVYSIPADPIDTDFDAAFHESIFAEILSDLGYQANSIYEGHAAVLAELESNNFTGIAASFGAGMTNCCIAYQSIPAVVLSTSRGGRWIDTRASKVSGVKQSKVTAAKEDGVDLMNPDGRIEKAIAIYYKELLKWTLENIAEKFKQSSDLPEFSDPVPLVATGGTSSPDGFADMFLEVYEETGFPIEIRDFRVAEDPLNSVCKGCLVSAQI